MIHITDLSKKFGETEILNGITLQIKEGEVFGIIGESGAGKSTLLRCINGLSTYDSGSLKVMGSEVKNLSGKDMREHRKKIGMIFQSFNLMNRLDVYHNIALPLKNAGYTKKQIEERVNELLKLVKLQDKIHSRISELSGGQKQRVAIARAIGLEPKILLCDEATSALDPANTRSILELIRDINKELNITIIIVTHEMEVIKEVCHKVAFISDGRIKNSGEVENFFLNPQGDLKEIIGQQFLLPNNGINIRLFFPSEISNNAIITKMARELQIDFSICAGKLEKISEKMVGSLVINVEKEHSEKILQYLKGKNINFEVMA